MKNSQFDPSNGEGKQNDLANIRNRILEASRDNQAQKSTALSPLQTDLLRQEKESLLELFGPSTRKDFFEITNDNIKENCARVGAIVEIIPGSEISFSKAGHKIPLCPDQPYYDHKYINGFIGTAFQFDSKRIITTKHISEVRSLDNLWFIPNYKYQGLAELPVMQPVKISSASEKGTPEGWSILYLENDSPIPIPAINRTQIAAGKKIYMIGHPHGMPQKIAFGEVIEHSGPTFRMYIAGFDGNSGSPVFTLDTHELIGMFYEGKENLSTHRELPFPDSPIPICHRFKNKLGQQNAHHCSALIKPLKSWK